nr:histidine kinase [Demequina sp. TTPB684]
MLLLLPLVAQTEPDIAVSTPGPSDWPWWLALGGVLAQSACLAWSSAPPQHRLIAVSALAAAIAIVPLGGAAGIVLLAVAPAAYVAARRRAATDSWTPWILATALAALAGTLSSLRSGDQSQLVETGAAVLQAAVIVWLPTLAGSTLGVRAAARDARERELIARAHEHEARVEAALSAERTAIARELHDIAAHHLSGIALMASAISQQIDTDPGAAKSSLADVRAQTRTLLDELRGLVALLRHDDCAAVEVESLAGLETLIPAAAARGLDVTLSVPAGTSLRALAQGIGPLGQFAAYRTVQEALANAARHAPHARCAVTLSDLGTAIEIVVTNAHDAAALPSGDGQGGFGLRGMEERAALTRARLNYGPTDDGGWRVALRVPRESVPEATADSGDAP